MITMGDLSLLVILSNSVFCSGGVKGRIHDSCHTCVGFHWTVRTCVFEIKLIDLIFISLLPGVDCTVYTDTALTFNIIRGGLWLKSVHVSGFTCWICHSHSTLTLTLTLTSSHSYFLPLSIPPTLTLTSSHSHSHSHFLPLSFLFIQYLIITSSSIQHLTSFPYRNCHSEAWWSAHWLL